MFTLSYYSHHAFLRFKLSNLMWERPQQIVLATQIIQLLFLATSVMAKTKVAKPTSPSDPNPLTILFLPSLPFWLLTHHSSLNLIQFPRLKLFQQTHWCLFQSTAPVQVTTIKKTQLTLWRKMMVICWLLITPIKAFQPVKLSRNKTIFPLPI